MYSKWVYFKELFVSELSQQLQVHENYYWNPPGNILVSYVDLSTILYCAVGWKVPIDRGVCRQFTWLNCSICYWGSLETETLNFGEF